jgi:hypothetical protein
MTGPSDHCCRSLRADSERKPAAGKSRWFAPRFGRSRLGRVPAKIRLCYAQSSLTVRTGGQTRRGSQAPGKEPSVTCIRAEGNQVTPFT